MKNLRKIGISVLAVLLFASCTNDADYANLIPDDAYVVAKFNVAQIIDKADINSDNSLTETLIDGIKDAELTAETKDKLTEIINNPAELGIDVRKPIYLYMCDNQDFGVVGAVSDDAKLEELLSAASNEGACSDIINEDMYSYVSVENEIVIAYDASRIIIHPLTYNERNDETELTANINKQFNLGTENSIVSNEAFSNVMSNDNDLSYYMSGNAMKILAEEDRDFREIMQMYETLNINVDEIDYIASINFDNGETNMTYEVIPTSDKAEETLNLLEDCYSDISGVHFDYLKSSSVVAIACGFNGKGLTKFLDETEILDLITNNADDEENELIHTILSTIESIDGDITVGVSELDSKSMPKCKAIVETKDNSLFNLLEMSLNQNGEFQQVSDSQYTLGFGETSMTFGVDGSDTYFLIGETQLEEESSSLDDSDFNGKKFCAYIYVDELIESEMFDDYFRYNQEYKLFVKPIIKKISNVEVTGNSRKAELKIKMKDSDTNLLTEMCKTLNQVISALS
jgi:hypothetical protein